MFLKHIRSPFRRNRIGINLIEILSIFYGLVFSLVCCFLKGCSAEMEISRPYQMCGSNQIWGQYGVDYPTEYCPPLCTHKLQVY